MASSEELAKKLQALSIINDALKCENEALRRQVEEAEAAGEAGAAAELEVRARSAALGRACTRTWLTVRCLPDRCRKRLRS